MSPPSAVHPVTGRPREAYVTIVLERLPDSEDCNIPLGDLLTSLADGTECKTFPGYRVQDFAPGDYIATAIQAHAKEPTS